MKIKKTRAKHFIRRFYQKNQQTMKLTEMTLSKYTLFLYTLLLVTCSIIGGQIQDQVGYCSHSTNTAGILCLGIRESGNAYTESLDSGRGCFGSDFDCDLALITYFGSSNYRRILQINVAVITRITIGEEIALELYITPEAARIQNFEKNITGVHFGRGLFADNVPGKDKLQMSSGMEILDEETGRTHWKVHSNQALMKSRQDLSSPPDVYLGTSRHMAMMVFQVPVVGYSWSGTSKEPLDLRTAIHVYVVKYRRRDKNWEVSVIMGPDKAIKVFEDMKPGSANRPKTIVLNYPVKSLDSKYGYKDSPESTILSSISKDSKPPATEPLKAPEGKQLLVLILLMIFGFTVFIMLAVCLILYATGYWKKRSNRRRSRLDNEPQRRNSPPTDIFANF